MATTTSAPTSILYNARYTRGVVDTYKNDFATVLEESVKKQMYLGGHKYVADVGVYPTLAYEGACTNENLGRMGVRHDLWLRASNALAALTSSNCSPLRWEWSMYAPKSAEREEIASIAADWLSVVYNWVSLALCSVNVQPRFLFPMTTTTVGVSGEYKPSGRNFPTQVLNAISTIEKTAGDAGKALTDSGMLGPAWMGLYDDTPTGWMDCNFAPQPDGAALGLSVSKYRNGSLRNGNPTTWTANIPLAAAYKPENAGMTMLNKTRDPWFLWYYNILASPDCQNLVTEWRINPAQARDANYSRFVVGPRGAFLLAQAWGEYVIGSSVFETAQPSYAWYTNNHMVYWSSLGLLDYTMSEIDSAQRATAAALVQAKGAAAMKAINSTAAAAMAVPNPIVQGVAAGIALVGSLITMGVVKRRAKRKANQVAKPLPLTLRTMTDVACATFGANLKLTPGLEEAARQLMAGDDRAAPAAAVASTEQISTVTTVTTANNPAGTSTVTPTNVAPGSGDATGGAPPPPPADQVIAAADNPALLAQPTPPPPTTSASTKTIPTSVWVGIGIITAALLVRSARKG